MEEHDHAKCQDLLGSLSDYVDGELSDALCADLEQHLRGCVNCRVVVDTLRKTIELYHHEAEVEGIPENVRMRLFHCLDLDDYRKE
jgi:anti-sigma factor RsiW